MEDLHHNQAFFALNVAKLLMYITSKGYSVSLGEAWRPPEMAAIYAKEGKGIVHSQHIKRLAIDLNFFNQQGVLCMANQEIVPFGEYWESLCNANRWGGYFVSKYGGHINDPAHFEMKDSE